MQDGKHRASTHYLNEVKRNGDPLCSSVATYLSDLCPGFVASDMAPQTFIRHVIYSTDRFEPLPISSSTNVHIVIRISIIHFYQRHP